MSIRWDIPYAPQLAANGSFAPIDMSTITSYPTSFTNQDGLTCTPMGRYAVLTYNIGTDTSSTVLSGGLPNTTLEQLVTFNTNTSSVITFAPAVTLMEVSNRSSGSIYISYANPVTNFPTLTAAGLEIAKGSFYSIERTVANVTIGSVAGGNVVVFGHYKA